MSSILRGRILEDVQASCGGRGRRARQRAQTGFHGHDNPASLWPTGDCVRAGAVQIAGSVRGLGAAPATPARGFAGGRSARHHHGQRRAGIDGCAQKKSFAPDGHECIIDRLALVMGTRGLLHFLKHAFRATSSTGSAARMCLMPA